MLPTTMRLHRGSRSNFGPATVLPQLDENKDLMGAMASERGILWSEVWKRAKEIIAKDAGVYR